MNEQENLRMDIYRTHVLSRLISAWGHPRTRTSRIAPNHSVEFWSFCNEKNSVWRFISLTLRRLPEHCDNDANELLLVLDGRSVGSEVERLGLVCVENLFNQLQLSTCVVETPRVLESSLDMPWPATCWLLDEVRGESEGLMEFQFPSRTVDYIWAIPLYSREIDFMRKEGIDALDSLTASAELVDPYRPPVV